MKVVKSHHPKGSATRLFGEGEVTWARENEGPLLPQGLA